ncbi:hypothetical protein [Escherichia coli]|uniref:hypothetical protein n=1 Tax=Escherichia coli TaxID=562 RepID=UPI001E4D840B|nr:hypothetical protein [Escherichia coli]MCE3906553.1 hypothetical protein [Escherichia coli]
MAKAWKDVIASPQYQALTEEQKAQAQAQYFDEVVAPKAGDKWAEARDQFYAAYPPPQQQKEEPSLMQQAGDWLTGGQSAGQIVEQAGRGLVNIPFDVLQGGASLINAISQGLGGPKVLDDVYRPVDRPTDPYAQAGESIGGYLVPGAGVAGNMVIGSLADAANQRGDFAENAAINAGLNIATHGLINGVTRGVRGASNIISGNKTSAQRATTAATETSPFSGDAAAATNPAVHAAAATNPAVHAAEARVAQGVPMTPATRNPEEVVRTVAAQKRPNLASSLDELDINPQAEVLESAERLNVDSLLPSHFSGNEQYKAVEQAIKSRAGSALRVQENEAIRQLAQGAGEIIDRVSGAKDALGMSDKFIDTVNGRMSALMKRSDQLYRNVEKAMPAGAKIDAPSTRSMLKQVAEDLGGMKNLDPIEKRVFRAVNPGKNGALTYANLNKQRRLVGDALHKNSGPYKDADRAALSRLYGSLADDQKAALSETNALRDFEVAQRLVQMRKSMEEQMINLTGRTLNGDVSRKATTALQAMSKGDAKGFRELMQNTPSRKLRTELLGTGLRDMLSNGKRGADFNPAGFADWYQNMLANGQMRNLARHLPKETMSGLNDVYKVAKAIKDAKSYEITTGRLNEFVKRFNRVTAANEFVANHAQRIGTAVGSTVSGPFSAVGAVAGSEIGAKVASKIRAMGGAASMESAEKLISSPEFQKAARLAVRQAPESIVDTTVRRSSAWRSFYNSLPESDKKTISRLGIMYWMNSDDNQK